MPIVSMHGQEKNETIAYLLLFTTGYFPSGMVDHDSARPVLS
jgi:hypothetical protein